MSLLLAYYGDDFTGSIDTLELLARSGARTVLFTASPTPEQLTRYPVLDAVGVAGLSRSLPPLEMERDLYPAFTALRALEPRHVHYKVCSTFDSSPTVGSIGRAIEIGADVFAGDFVPLVVAAPALGRYCVFGNLFARSGLVGGGTIDRLDRHPTMSRHPITPADEADLRVHLAKQTQKRVELFDILTVAKPAVERQALLDRMIADRAEIVLFDVLEPEHLRSIGALLEPLGRDGQPLFSVGSSAIEMALVEQWTGAGRLQPPTWWADPGAAKPLLVISDSCSPVTVEQTVWATRNGFTEIVISPGARAIDVEGPLRAAKAELRAGRHVVVHTSHGPTLSGVGVPAERLGTTLGQVARGLIAVAGVKRLLIAGGDTSSYAARALGIEAVEMITTLVPGAPLCRAHAPGSPVDGIEVNFKGDQVGAENHFGVVANGRL